MDRSGKLLTAALVRPLNLLAPGAGLLLALSDVAPWFAFPLSLVPYGLMVWLSARDPKFIERSLREDRETETGEQVEWDAIQHEIPGAEISAPLRRIASSERKLTDELSSAPSGARSMLAGTLAQVRSAARLGIELARRIKSLDHTLGTYEAMDIKKLRFEADERRRRATQATDPQARESFFDAAKSLEETAASAGAMQKLRERTMAQLENLAASLESVAVRTIRLRVSTDEEGGATDISETLRVDIEAVKETLSVFEESVAMQESPAKENP